MNHDSQSANLRTMLTQMRRIVRGEQEVTMVWWLPLEFFEAALAEAPALPSDQECNLRAGIGAIADYAIFALMHARIVAGALSDCSSREQLLDNAEFRLAGETRPPLPIDAIPASVRSVLAGLKPGLVQSAGPLGQYLEIVVYPATGGGFPPEHPVFPRTLTFTLMRREFQWRLP